VVVSRAVEILGRPELAWLVDRIRRRLEAGEPLGTSVRLADPSGAQTDAYARIFGYPRGRALVVDLAALASILRDAGAGTLEEALVAVGGPLLDRRALAERDAAAWEDVLGPLSRWAAWREDLRQTGLVRRLGAGDLHRAADLVAQAAAVAARLPAGGVLLAELASSVTGNAHALDQGEPLAAVVLRHVHRLAGTDGTDRRLAWSAVGVELDPLSSSVLVLNVRASGSGPVPGLLAACADAGEPVRLTLRQLRAIEFVDGPLFACENPSIVAAAADRLGAASAPLLCTEGQPRSATRAFLRLCRGPVLYHGDFDWPGLRIANEVLTLTGGRPWRMATEDYAAALKGAALAGAPVDPCWSGTLGNAMREVGRSVHEEAVLDVLLADLLVAVPFQS
jgi:uncharacterized protein (TIGR02679 family)